MGFSGQPRKLSDRPAKLRPSQRNMPSYVWIQNLAGDVQPRYLTGGFLGPACDPFLVAGEPHKPDFRPLALTLPDDVPPDRLQVRVGLRQQLDAAARSLEVRDAAARDRLSQAALPRFGLRRDQEVTGEGLAAGRAQGEFQVPASRQPGHSALRLKPLAQIEEHGFATGAAHAEPYPFP